MNEMSRWQNPEQVCRRRKQHYTLILQRWIQGERISRGQRSLLTCTVKVQKVIGAGLGGENSRGGVVPAERAVPVASAERTCYRKSHDARSRMSAGRGPAGGRQGAGSGVKYLLWCAPPPASFSPSSSFCSAASSLRQHCQSRRRRWARPQRLQRGETLHPDSRTRNCLEVRTQTNRFQRTRRHLRGVVCSRRTHGRVDPPPPMVTVFGHCLCERKQTEDAGVTRRPAESSGLSACFPGVCWYYPNS